MFVGSWVKKNGKVYEEEGESASGGVVCCLCHHVDKAVF